MTSFAGVLDLTCPLRFCKVMWPHVKLYDKQQEIVMAVKECPEVFVPAGNQLGKDYVAGLICAGAFVAPGTFLGGVVPDDKQDEVRIVTTSVKDDHLRVLFGEILRFIQTARLPLRMEDGGHLIVNHRDVRKLKRDGTVCPISYLRGMVSERGEGLAGHHAARTLAMGDEASAIDDLAYTQFGTWAKRQLYFGNCNPPRPGASFFKELCEKGDLEA